MRVLYKILKITERISGAVFSAVLVMAAVYTLYCITDEANVYVEAAQVKSEVEALRPDKEEEAETSESLPDFSKLMAINGDIRGWITLDGTNIDYPVVQGETNQIYLNTDVFGENSLSGSIFLDYRNEGGFSDFVSLLYGHYMSGGSMFGELALYKDTNFFLCNRTGTLLTPTCSYDLEIFAVLLVSASDDCIFNPVFFGKGDAEFYLSYVKENAIMLDEAKFSEALETEDLKILELSTCSYEFTGARTVVIAIMKEALK